MLFLVAVLVIVSKRRKGALPPAWLFPLALLSLLLLSLALSPPSLPAARAGVTFAGSDPPSMRIFLIELPSKTHFEQVVHTFSTGAWMHFFFFMFLYCSLLFGIFCCFNSYFCLFRCIYAQTLVLVNLTCVKIINCLVITFQGGGVTT